MGPNQQRFSAKTTKVSVWERLKEYPGQHFAVGRRKAGSSIDRHTKSKKHETGLASIRRNKTESQSIKECLQKRARQESAAGSTLPSEKQLYRYELIESALLAGVPLSKIEGILEPTQRLTRLELLTKVLKGDELAQRLISCLAVD